MKCLVCNRDLQPGEELKWECNSCHQFCRANLQMLEQVQTQREKGYTAAMVNCPFCGTVLDDGNETIHWDCIACGNRTTATIKNYVRPEMFEQEEEAEPEQEDSANQSEFAWFDSDGEAMEEPPKADPPKQDGFFTSEEEKKEFLAETKSQVLGEEIPDSIFDDVPIRRPRNKESSSGTVSSETPSQAPASTNAASAANPFVEPPQATPPQATPSRPSQAAPTGPSLATPSSQTAPTQTASSRPQQASQTETTPQTAQAQAYTAPPKIPDTPSSSVPESFSHEPSELPSKQTLPKVLTGILAVLIVATVCVGIFFVVRFFMAPTRQFRSAVQKADYTKASELYDNEIKGNTDDEDIAKIAVEHFLHERYDAFKNGSGGEDAYKQILEFAQTKMGMDTSDYEVGNEPEETVEPAETSEPTESPVVETTEAPEVTAEPEATPEATEEVVAEVTEEPVEPAEPQQTEAPAADSQPAGSEDEITAAVQKADNYIKKKKYEKAYNHLAQYKDVDTTGQVAKKMSSIKKDWKSYNIKTFKALCDKLTIIYYASEKRYHIVPRGYYTNYNQISRSNNVGGIAYMDQQKKQVSVTNIGKDRALSSLGKTNRANLNEFKEMIEKYPYLAKEIK